MWVMIISEEMRGIARGGNRVVRQGTKESKEISDSGY